MIGDMWRRVRSAVTARERVSGEPSSRNGASSLHLAWELPQVPLIEVSATLEVLQPPAVRRTYFWALQVSFASERTLRGGAHLGLQWNRRHRGCTAANWGGYAPGDHGATLRGSESSLPGLRSDPNTRQFPWEPGRRYLLRVAPSPDSPPEVHAWRGSITDVESGRETVVRDLYTDGAYLATPMVWTESFARCEHPGVAVRWSDLRAVDQAGRQLRPARVRVNYQSRSEGGCDNTTASVDELGIVQATSVPRQVPQGALLAIPGS
ncbi:MAG: hypothetical protein QY307_02350 [Acidimicrobiia bacterium]|nr:MAG: hypothetical protein QY307_02350 [Acidimicrobiia bacterium]